MQYPHIEIIFAIVLGNITKFLNYQSFAQNEYIALGILFLGFPIIYYCTKHRFLSYTFFIIGATTYALWAQAIGFCSFPYSELSITNTAGITTLFMAIFTYTCVAIITHLSLTLLHTIKIKLNKF